MELTEEQSMAMDFIGEQTNRCTRDGKNDEWKDNIVKNREAFSKGNPTLAGIVTYVVCAGPGLVKNAHELKNISHRGIIVCVDAALRYLVKCGITPEYCIMIDASDKIMTMTEGVDTSNITLICTPSANPKVIDYWKGPKFFVSTPYVNVDRKYNMRHLTRIVKAKCDIKEGDELMLDEQYEVSFEGIHDVILCGGNVSTAAHHFAAVHLKSQKIVFVGLDLSWEFDNHHYAGAEHQENYRDRTKTGVGTAKDLNGKEVSTNLSLLSFKRWHEAIAKQPPRDVVNATEGGILGVEQDGSRVDYMDFMTLAEAIEKFTPLPSANGKESK